MIDYQLYHKYTLDIQLRVSNRHKVHQLLIVHKHLIGVFLYRTLTVISKMVSYHCRI